MRTFEALRGLHLKARITLFSLALFVAAIWALAYVTSRDLRNDMRELLANQQLGSVGHAAGLIDSALKARLTALTRSAEQVAPNWLTNPPRLARFLADPATRRSPFTLGVFAISLDGACLASNLAVAPVCEPQDQTASFRDIVAEGKPFSIRTGNGPGSRQPAIVIAVPLRDALGHTVGVLEGITDIYGGGIFDNLDQSTELGNTGAFVVLAAQEKVYITGTDHGLALQPFATPDAANGAGYRRVVPQDNGAGVAEYADGSADLYAARVVPSSGWMVVGLMPAATAFAPFDDMARRLYRDAAVTTLLVAILMWLFVHREIAPLGRASKRIRAMSSGAAPLQSLPLEGHGEIRLMLESFNAMQAYIVSHDEELRASEMRYRQLFEYQTSAFALLEVVETEPGKVSDLVFLEINVAFEGLVGKKARHVVGRTLTQVRLLDLHWIEDLGRVARAGRPLEVECQDAQLGRWLGVRAFSPRRRQCALIIDDISVRKVNEEQLSLAASVFSGTSEAILVTDGENRIVTVNPAFSAITGYSAEEVMGQDPKLLSSGRQDHAFYTELWRQLLSSGQWQGEIWNRRKDGNVYPEWLSITTLRDETGQVRRHIAIFSDITEKKRAEEMIWRQANYDALTGLPNRRLFRDRLEQELKKAHREKHAVALLFIDLDRFKDVNDTLGHLLGDQLLVESARRIAALVRETDTVARLGGDEFTVILSGLGDMGRIDEVADGIVCALCEPFRLGDETAYVSASVGITLYPGDGEDIDTLIKHADQAMYAAKDLGRNCYSYFTGTIQAAAQWRRQLSKDLRLAVAEGQFEVHYQPIVDLNDGRYVKAEALLRWNHPTLGHIAPAEFIPLAEETGLINLIGDWVFAETARTARHLCDLARASGHSECPLQFSVNKSPRQFYAANGHDAWLGLLEEIALPPHKIAIEITEGLMLDDRAEVKKKLREFRDAGIELALDDFGTGYSAMGYLQKFDIDYLKIDQSFIRDMTDSIEDRAIVEAIIAMAHKLGIRVIAEGVETECQRDMLTAAGCDLAQGYLFARPMPKDEFLQRMCAQCQCAGPKAGPDTADRH